jgi:hypothetical protein
VALLAGTSLKAAAGLSSARILMRRTQLLELLWQASTWAVVEGGTVVVCKKHAKYEPLQALGIDPSADQWLQKQAGGPTSPHTKL